jgi:hypothetical protein
MVVNFRAREISRGEHKLFRIPMLIKKKHFIGKYYETHKTVINAIFSIHACKMKPKSTVASRNLFKLIHLNNYGHNITKATTLIPCLN